MNKEKLLKYIPDCYYENILKIDYQKLKKENIKCLLFDVDNTIVPYNISKIKEELKELFQIITKEFKVYLVSNNIAKKRVSKIAATFSVSYTYFARKPSPQAFIKFTKDFAKDEVVIIGDQLLSDIYGGNNFGIKTILVDPIAKDSIFTYFNRLYEKKIFKELKRQNLFEKGKYYD